MRRLALVLAAALAGCGTRAAEGPAGAEPAPTDPAAPGADTGAAGAVAMRALTAHADMDWPAVVALLHPDLIEQMREVRLMEARLDVLHGNRSSPAVYPPDMPPEVVEWFEKQRREFETERDSLLERTFGVETVDELEALPVEVLLARSLAATDPRTSIVQRLQASPDTALARQQDSLVRSLEQPPRLVGTVLEGDSVAHVLFRGGGVLGPPDGTRVLTLRRYGDGWRIGDLDGLGVLGTIGITGIYQIRPDLEEVAERGVEWQSPDGGTWAARIVGCESPTRPPRGLRVETVDADGDPVRIEIPVAAFASLVELLEHWVHWSQ